MSIHWQNNSLMTHDEWLVSRNKSLGASEVGAIVFGSKWTSSLEIWYNKVTGSKNFKYNLRMYLGNKTEQISSEMWEFYDETEQSVVENERKGTPVRKCINLNSTAFNSEFPWLSATPDRTILPFGKHAHRSSNGALEIKNTTSWALNSYENKLPTENVMQIVTQMMCCDYDYGEIFYFIDNASLKLYPIEKKDTKKVQDVILLHTSKFWESIEKARPIYNKLYESRRTFDMRGAALLEVELAKLEPPYQNTESYRSFLTQRYKDRVANVGVVQGNNEQLLLAQTHKKICTDIDKLEVKKRDFEIKLKMEIKDNYELNFGKSGKLTYYPNKNGDRLFKNLVTK